MAKTEKQIKAMERQEKLATEQFVEYKSFLAGVLWENFRKSYQTREEIQETWRKQYQYSAEMETFVKHWTRLFLRLLPTKDIDYSSPQFFKALVHKISGYLAKYICRQDELPGISNRQQNLDFDKYRNELYTELYTNNSYIKRRMTEFHKEQQREIARQQTAALRELALKETSQPTPSVKKEKRPRIQRPVESSDNGKLVHVVYTPEQIERLNKRRNKVLLKIRLDIEKAKEI